MNSALSKQQFLLLFSLYISQCMGLGFFTEAFIGILRENGVPLEHLGIIYMLGLFWVVRFLWAPFIDSISFKKLGHYRGWIIIFQSLMCLILLLTSFFDLMDNLWIVVTAAVLFSFCSASQGIALDALVFKTVSIENRPTANAIQSSGGMVGMVFGGGVGLILYEYIGWSWTMFILAISTCIGLLFILRYQEPKKEDMQHSNQIDYKQFVTFWAGKRRKQWFVFLILYPVTISVAYGMLTPMLVDLKWTLDKIGFYVHVVGYSIGVMSSFISSWLINQYGKRNVLIVAAMGQTIGLLLLLLLAFGYDSVFMVMFVVGFVFSFYTPSTVVLTTLMMDESSEKTPASQFAIQHSINMFSGIFFSGLGISLAGVIGYPMVIAGGAVIGLIVIAYSFRIELIKSDSMQHGTLTELIDVASTEEALELYK